MGALSSPDAIPVSTLDQSPIMLEMQLGTERMRNKVLLDSIAALCNPLPTSLSERYIEAHPKWAFSPVSTSKGGASGSEEANFIPSTWINQGTNLIPLFTGNWASVCNPRIRVFPVWAMGAGH